MPFFIESWFWRGTQSAVFYYLSCTPCVENRHKRQRRKQAAKSERARAEVITVQPGAIAQPGPFQTNQEWAEEILAGPGPPKGWKADKVLRSLKKARTNETGPLVATDGAPLDIEPFPSLSAEDVEAESRGDAHVPPPDPQPSSSAESNVPATSPVEAAKGGQRPRHDRKVSSTFDTIKDTLRSSLHPEKWNWIRYEREDEVLWPRGVHEKMSRMWDRARNPTSPGGAASGRKRADTRDSDHYDYYRARNPAVNELHPPIVSTLPDTREEVAWMLLPPPSAAVMAGKVRPETEPPVRWPLSRIGSTPEEFQLRELRSREAPLGEVQGPAPAVSRDSEETQNTAVATPPQKQRASRHSWDSGLHADSENGGGHEPELSSGSDESDIEYLDHAKSDALLRGKAHSHPLISKPAAPIPQRWSYGEVWVA